jgi:L-2-aminoadipate reductase
MAQNIDSSLQRWAERLKSLTITSLTTDYPEPILAESGVLQRPIEATQTISLSEEVQGALKQLQITDGPNSHTSFSILLAALVVLSARLTGDEDIALGTSGVHGEPFVLRTPYDSKQPFVELLNKVGQVRYATIHH